MCQSEQEKEEALINNDLHLSFTEKRIWDMWRRWRVSGRTLWPWDYMTKVAHPEDVIDIECLESMIAKLERQEEEYSAKLEQTKANRPNPNVKSLM